MPLLPEHLKSRLPPLGSQEDSADPIVYARLYLPGTSWNFYVIEGGVEDWYWVLYCFYATDKEAGFSRFPLDVMEGLHSPNGSPLVLDPDFHEGPLTDVVPAPEF